MACHCRRVIHPVLGPSVATVSVHVVQFADAILREIPTDLRYRGPDYDALFVCPSQESRLLEVAARHFGMGAIWDTAILPGLQGWSPPRWKRRPPEPRRPTRSTRVGGTNVSAEDVFRHLWSVFGIDPLTGTGLEPEPRSPELRQALSTLGVPAETATLAEATGAYRRGCLTRHPDRGGSDAAMAEWNLAYEVVKRELG